MICDLPELVTLATLVQVVSIFGFAVTAGTGAVEQICAGMQGSTPAYLEVVGEQCELAYLRNEKYAYTMHINESRIQLLAQMRVWYGNVFPFSATLEPNESITTSSRCKCYPFQKLIAEASSKLQHLKNSCSKFEYFLQLM